MIDSELRVRVLGVRELGGLELAVGGRPLVELASAKAAALVVYLTVTGTAHSRSALAGLLWSDLPEAAARANLRLVLTKLRRVLPEHLVVTRSTVAVAGPVRLDVAELGRVADDELLTAVRLCRGDFLDGFELAGAELFTEWQTARRAAVRTEMLALMDRALQWAVSRSDATAGIEVARRRLELDRLHEEAHRALMWFLTLGGQRTAALAQYETCRYLLREELGLDPSAATTALRDEIDAGGSFTELRVPPELPRPLTTLIGRGRELARIHELLDDPAGRLVTLVGPGGAGKTRLALAIASARKAVFVSYVGTDLVVATLTRALGLSTAVPGDPLELLTGHLAGRDLLLVLDNLEHLPDAAGVVAEVLRRAPGVKVLATSRRRLGLGAEWLVEIAGLPCPPPEAGADAAGYEAVQLFTERARALRPGLPADAAADVGRVCRLVAGLPLAIELAAQRIRSAGPAVIADRLAEGLDLLETTAPDVEPRHRSLRAVLDWSCRLLTADELRALRRLSVLRRGFDLPAATAVTAAGLPLLAGLIDQSLVTVAEDGRYAMHELLRQYAADLLAGDPADEALTRQRHAAHYAGLLSTGDPANLAAELDNLDAATRVLIDTAEPADLDAHLGRVWALYRSLGWFREAQVFFAAALRRPELTALQRARWHRLLGEAHQQLGAAGPARDQLELALAVLGVRVPAGPRGQTVASAGQLGRRALARLRPGRAAPRPDQREAARERSAASFTISEVYWVLEDRTAILPASLRALNDAERAGDLDLTVRAHAGLGMVLGTAGLHRPARRHLRSADADVERAADPLTACWVAIMGGLHGIGTGDWAAVQAGVARALDRPGRVPMHRWADEALLISASARYLSARHPEATAAATDGLAAGRARRDPSVQIWGLAVLIETALRRDPADPASAQWCREATGLLPEVARIDAARVHVGLARLHLAAGQTAAAWQSVRTADRLIGAGPTVEQYALEALAGVPEICLALAESGTPGPGEADRGELRPLTVTASRRLHRYARTYPIAQPRVLLCRGRLAWLDGHTTTARRSWCRALREAERLRMPYEVAWAHLLLGRHLAAGRLSPLGLDREQHLAKATAGFRAIGCRTP